MIQWPAQHKSIACYSAQFGCLLLPVVLLGCATLRVKTGQRVDIHQIQPTSLSLRLAEGAGIAPGRKAPLIAMLQQADGAQLLTEGAGHGKVMWNDLKLSATGVSVNQKGELLLDPDPRVSWGTTPRVEATLAGHPELHAVLDLPLRYDVDYTAEFSGSDGISGISGQDGMSGSSGSMGSHDVEHPQAGGDGGDGTNGSDGTSGSAGNNGPAVTVHLTFKPGERLLQASVEANHKQQLFLIDPRGGQLFVTTQGGNGGRGGAGGKGGRGGSGGSGSPSGHNGRDGSDGQNGSDGIDGSGGPITVFYDPAVQPFLGVLHLLSPRGPKPVIREIALNPLW